MAVVFEGKPQETCELSRGNPMMQAAEAGESAASACRLADLAVLHHAATVGRLVSTKPLRAHLSTFATRPTSGVVQASVVERRAHLQ